MKISAILLFFPLLVLANPAPFSPAPQGLMGMIEARGESACCKSSGQRWLCNDGTKGTPCCGYGSKMQHVLLCLQGWVPRSLRYGFCLSQTQTLGIGGIEVMG
ncbi:uncharacterized protein MCYG_08740 [Microsporum canis CBS 113480]|uniref:Uncharacterized protein n=1 Tax=Arthroderma otae (strain ATCC MYA-4605 / CBS 113480) TaxID=554155 RepID=C5G1B8_ARTOC|nr:uncharacterized protein MCYG_08740 [Microsporum canis CBS 113480]EEQ28581.1 hypothetical protein MCYG_08740 [Microsporum canis CBS 113480]